MNTVPPHAVGSARKVDSPESLPRSDRRVASSDSRAADVAIAEGLALPVCGSGLGCAATGLASSRANPTSSARPIAEVRRRRLVFALGSCVHLNGVGTGGPPSRLKRQALAASLKSRPAVPTAFLTGKLEQCTRRGWLSSTMRSRRQTPPTIRSAPSRRAPSGKHSSMSLPRRPASAGGAVASATRRSEHVKQSAPASATCSGGSNEFTPS